MGGPPLFGVTINKSVERRNNRRCRQASISSALIGESVAFVAQAESIRECSAGSAARPPGTELLWVAPPKWKGPLLNKAPGLAGFPQLFSVILFSKNSSYLPSSLHPVYPFSSFPSRAYPSEVSLKVFLAPLKARFIFSYTISAASGQESGTQWVLDSMYVYHTE